MISVKKDFNSIPAKLLTAVCSDLKTDAILKKGKHKYKSAYYGAGCKKELESLYHNKCCFCESDPSPAAFWQVEHFRPKNKSPKKSPYGTHEGYYWLGYEWSNLLLVCQKCNNKKSSHFPIADQTLRLNSHSVDFAGNIIFLITDTVYQNEGHMLLNPEIDTVEDYFIFKPNGEIAGIDPEGRGALSIKLYGLQRERLVLGRKKIADDFFDEIKEALVKYNLSEINENSLIDILNLKFNTLRNKSTDKTLQYSRVWYFLYNKFEIFAREYLNTQGDLDLVKARFQIFIS